MYIDRNLMIKEYLVTNNSTCLIEKVLLENKEEKVGNSELRLMQSP